MRIFGVSVMTFAIILLIGMLIQSKWPTNYVSKTVAKV